MLRNETETLFWSIVGQLRAGQQDQKRVCQKAPAPRHEGVCKGHRERERSGSLEKAESKNQKKPAERIEDRRRIGLRNDEGGREAQGRTVNGTPKEREKKKGTKKLTSLLQKPDSLWTTKQACTTSRSNDDNLERAAFAVQGDSERNNEIMGRRKGKGKGKRQASDSPVGNAGWGLPEGNDTLTIGPGQSIRRHDVVVHARNPHKDDSGKHGGIMVTVHRIANVVQIGGIYQMTCKTVDSSTIELVWTLEEDTLENLIPTKIEAGRLVIPDEHNKAFIDRLRYIRLWMEFAEKYLWRRKEGQWILHFDHSFGKSTLDRCCAAVWNCNAERKDFLFAVR